MALQSLSSSWVNRRNEMGPLFVYHLPRAKCCARQMSKDTVGKKMVPGFVELMF